MFNYADHLGNIRLSYTKNPTTNVLTILEENNYYPFGLKHRNYNMTKRQYEKDEGNIIIGPTNQTVYDYKYNGKEWQDELSLNMYAMDMRQYDPAIARWVVQDPVTHHNFSPYSAFDNNPVFWADPSGADSERDYMGRDRFDSYGRYIAPNDRKDASGGERDDIKIRTRNSNTGEYEESLIIETDLIDEEIDLDIPSLDLNNHDGISNKSDERKPLVVKGLDDYLRKKFNGLPDAIYLNLGYNAVSLSSSLQVAFFLTGRDTGGIFIYTPNNPADATLGLLIGAGMEVGGISSNVSDFNRRTLEGKSINFAGGFKTVSGAFSIGVSNYLNFKNPLYTAFSSSVIGAGINLPSVKFGFGVSFSNQKLSGTIRNPQ